MNTSIINALNASSSSIAQGGASTKNISADMQNTFMTLLTAQLRNQDPLNPMDNAQMTTQLAQINTVGGINQLNATLQAMNNSMAASAATNMIGHGVLVQGNTISYSGNGPAFGGVQVTQPADSVTVAVKDSSGHVVRNMTLGALQAGIQPFAWDGNTDAGVAAAPGAYTFSVQAVAAGNAVPAQSLSYGQVGAVLPGGANGTTKLDVSQIGLVDMSAVLMVM